MEPRSLLKALPELIRPRIPSRLAGYRSAAEWSYLMKLYYGNKQIHYEASHRPRLRTIEIGLHFEADDLTNAQLLGALRAHERTIRRKLKLARFEEWDRGWTRIWEPVAYDRLGGDLRDDLASRLALYITTLEPIVRDELPVDVPWDVAPPRPRASSSR